MSKVWFTLLILNMFNCLCSHAQVGLSDREFLSKVEDLVLKGYVTPVAKSGHPRALDVLKLYYSSDSRTLLAERLGIALQAPIKSYDDRIENPAEVVILYVYAMAGDRSSFDTLVNPFEEMRGETEIPRELKNQRSQAIRLLFRGEVDTDYAMLYYASLLSYPDGSPLVFETDMSFLSSPNFMVRRETSEYLSGLFSIPRFAELRASRRRPNRARDEDYFAKELEVVREWMVEELKRRGLTVDMNKESGYVFNYLTLSREIQQDVLLEESTSQEVAANAPPVSSRANDLGQPLGNNKSQKGVIVAIVVLILLVLLAIGTILSKPNR